MLRRTKHIRPNWRIFRLIKGVILEMKTISDCYCNSVHNSYCQISIKLQH